MPKLLTSGPCAGLIALVFLIAGPTASAAELILLGSDYFHTIPNTQFQGVPFQGVPLPGLADADTIVQRRSDADVSGGPATTSLRMIALQLVSSVPVDFGAGVGQYYITLQSNRGGPYSDGVMVITPISPGQGTFTSSIDVFFDIRFGALNGPIVLSNDLILTTLNPINWDSNVIPGGLVVSGPVGDQNANSHNSKAPGQEDFWFTPSGFGAHVHTENANEIARHTVVGAAGVQTPEPGTFVLAGFAVALVALKTKFRRAGS